MKAMDLLQSVVDGKVRIKKDSSFRTQVIGSRPREALSPEDEVRAWKLYRQWAEKIEPKCGVTKTTAHNNGGAANSPEYRRRELLTGMFLLIDFRSRSPEVEALFKHSLGRYSLGRMLLVLGTRAPGWYYRWAVDVLPQSMRRITQQDVKDAAITLAESAEIRQVVGEVLNVLDEDLAEKVTRIVVEQVHKL